MTAPEYSLTFAHSHRILRPFAALQSGVQSTQLAQSITGWTEAAR